MSKKSPISREDPETQLPVDLHQIDSQGCKAKQPWPSQIESADAGTQRLSGDAELAQKTKLDEIISDTRCLEYSAGSPLNFERPANSPLGHVQANEISANPGPSLLPPDPNVSTELDISSFLNCPSQQLYRGKDQTLVPHAQTPVQASSTMANSRAHTPTLSAQAERSVGAMSFRERRQRTLQNLRDKQRAKETVIPDSATLTPQASAPQIDVHESTLTEQVARVEEYNVVSSSPHTNPSLRQPLIPFGHSRLGSPTARDRQSQAGPPQSPQLPPLSDQDVSMLLPLPLFEGSRTHYRKALDDEAEFLKTFVAADPGQVTGPQVSRAQELCTLLCDFTLHQDLVGDQPLRQLSQGGYTPKQLAQWSITVSSKFRFLSALFSAITDQGQSRMIALIVRPGLSLQYVKNFLEGSDVSYACQALGMRSSKDSPVNVVLSCTNDEIRQGLELDAIIGLDETFSPNNSTIQRLRQSGSKHDAFRPPAIGLIVPLSMEHFVRETPKSNNEAERLQSLLLRAYQARSHAGEGLVTKTSGHPEALARHLAEAIHDPARGFHLPALDDFPLSQIHSPRLQSLFNKGEAADISSSSSARNTPLTNKRPALDESMASSHNKRARTTPVNRSPEAMSSSGPQPATSARQHQTSTADEMTRITDSVYKPASHSTPSVSATQVRKYKDKIADLNSQLALRTAEIETLYRTVNVYQPEHQQLYRENAALKRELDQQATTANRLARAQECESSLRAQLKERSDRLAATETLLLGSTNPDIRELGKLREKAQESAALQAKFERLTNDQEYLRGLYQTASRSAADATTSLNEAEARLSTLEPRLAAAEAQEKATLRREFSTSSTTKLQREIDRLKAQLATRDNEIDAYQRRNGKLRKENDELKDRVGMGLHTRRAGSTQPGSRAGSEHPSIARATGTGTGSASLGRASENLLRAAVGEVIGSAHAASSGRTSNVASRTASRAGSPGPLMAGRIEKRRR